MGFRDVPLNPVFNFLLFTVQSTVPYKVHHILRGKGEVLQFPKISTDLEFLQSIDTVGILTVMDFGDGQIRSVLKYNFSVCWS